MYFSTVLETYKVHDQVLTGLVSGEGSIFAFKETVLEGEYDFIYICVCVYENSIMKPIKTAKR
jgi:hypothetical protein